MPDKMEPGCETNGQDNSHGKTAVDLGSCWLHRLSFSLSLQGTAIPGEFCYHMSWNTLTKTELIPVSPTFAIIY